MGHAAPSVMRYLSPFVLMSGALGAGLVAFSAASQSGDEVVGQALVYVIAAAFLGGIAELWLRARSAERLAAEVDALSRAGAGPDAVEAAESPGLREIVAGWRTGRVVGPPAAGFTPYLVSLVVMVGLLGTFMGFVDTLAGARAAISGSADLETLKAGLAQPLGGLGRAFGVSLAGVSASAALGAAAAFARRIEVSAYAGARTLVGGALADRAPTARQLVALEALSAQADALPRAAEALSQVVARLEALGPAVEAAQTRGAAQLSSTLHDSVRALQVEINAGFQQSTASARDAMAHLGDVAAERLAASGAEAFERWTTALDARFEALTHRVDAALAQTTRGVDEALSRAGAGEAERLAQQSAVVVAFQAQMVEGQRGAEASAASVRALVEAVQVAAAQTAQALPAQLERLGEALRRIESTSDAHAIALRTALTEAERVATARLDEAHARATDRLDAAQTAAAERLAATSQAMSSELAAHLDRFIAAQSERAGEAATVIARLDVSLSEHLASLGAALSVPLAEVTRAALEAPVAATRLVEAAAVRAQALEAREDDRAARMDALETARLARADALLEALASLEGRVQASVDAQAKRLAEFELRLAAERGASAQSLAEHLTAHATALGAGLDSTGALVREAADLVRAGGAELSAVAGLFGDSVDRYREASEHWRRTLVGIEEALHRSSTVGGGELGPALGTYLDQTREVFSDTLRFQRELFAELRALRGGNAA